MYKQEYLNPGLPFAEGLTLRPEQRVEMFADRIFREAAQTILIWRALLPTNGFNLQKNYRDNLNTLLPKRMPTASRKRLETISAILDDPELIMTRLDNSPRNRGAMHTAYQHITQRIIDHAKRLPPFIGNLPINFDTTPTPLPPDEFSILWLKTGQSEQIRAATSHLLTYHQGLIFLPITAALHLPSGHYGTGVGVILHHHDGKLTAVTLDEVCYAASLTPPHQHLKITNYQLHPESSSIPSELAGSIGLGLPHPLPEKRGWIHIYPNRIYSDRQVEINSVVCSDPNPQVSTAIYQTD